MQPLSAGSGLADVEGEGEEPLAAAAAAAVSNPPQYLPWIEKEINQFDPSDPGAI